MGRTLPANEHAQDPRDFYASDSPVLNNSDSDQEVTNRLRISRRRLRQKAEVVSKSAAVLQGYV
jgi:hypothetical protein